MRKHPSAGKDGPGKFDRARVALVRWTRGRVIGMVTLVWVAYHTQVLLRAFPEPKAAAPLPPDLHLVYTPAHLRQDFTFWSQQRAAFLQAHLLVDNVYPLIYGLLLALLLTALRPRRFSDKAPWWALVLPMGMVMADWSENLLLSLLMLVYPRLPEPWAWMAALSTTTKWTLLGGQLGCMLWSAAQRLRKTP